MEKLLYFNKTGYELIRKGLEIDEKLGMSHLDTQR